MKYTVVTTLLALFLLVAGARPASATEVGYGRKIGLGFVLGDPTGLSGKYWVGPTNAFDFALGFTNGEVHRLSAAIGSRSTRGVFPRTVTIRVQLSPGN